MATPCIASDEIPPLAKLLEEGYEKVPPADGSGKTMYTLYVKEDTRDVLAVLPADYEKQQLLLGFALARGFDISGIQGNGAFLHWKRYGNRMGLVMPQLNVRTSGDLESERSRELLYTDGVLADLPIVALGPDDAPVVDLDDLFVTQSKMFFQFSPGGLDLELVTSMSVKAFEENIRLSFELPWRARGSQIDGRLITLTYSISLLPEKPDYTPREADHRVGYFITGFDDLARMADMTTRVRYIKRWKLEKADPSLKLSPPRDPIVFYIDHKTPIRYRRWVREGLLEWNRAFEAAGFVNAIEVYQQDARSGAHMEKEPEDIHHNFIVWNSNDVGFAIGPCRVDPRTGQILDADVVINDGWIRYAVSTYRKFLAGIAMEGMGRETLDWLQTRPQWDPRVRFATPIERAAPDVHAAPVVVNGGNRVLENFGSGYRCGDPTHRAMDLALTRLSLIDDVPEEFVGMQIKDLVMHEVGHVIGLRHNFKASAAYSMEQINSPQWKDRPISASVMDYNAVNFDYDLDDGDTQGPHFMTTLGPYDIWAIRYGYADKSQLESILAKATEPQLAFLTDEDVYGPDPTARTRDLGRNALDFVDTEMALVQRLRGRIIERALEEGKSYQRVRDAYLTLLGIHQRDLYTAARYIGGLYVHRDRVGDVDRNPTEVVSAAEQRRALRQILEYGFRDEAFGLTPELLDNMSYDKWFDGAYIRQDMPDPQLDVHDLVLGAQASVLTTLINPTRLRRIYDNEMRLGADADAFTLGELIETIHEEIWRELEVSPAGISSLRRNLQREYIDRMIDLTLPGGMTGAAAKPVASLAAHHLRSLHERIETFKQTGDQLDTYTLAHLEDASHRIEKALDALYLYH
jgi:hypothetical protein